jgi:hypothetical protein
VKKIESDVVLIFQYDPAGQAAANASLKGLENVRPRRGTIDTRKGKIR